MCWGIRLVLSLFISAVSGAGVTEPNTFQLKLLAQYPGVEFAFSKDSLAFDRWRLRQGLQFQTILSQAVAIAQTEVDQRGIVILDTNPDAKKWRHLNIIDEEEDRLFLGRHYAELSEGERAAIFARFSKRIQQRLDSRESAVAIIDHHFESHLMTHTSTTPMTVDFLSWLQDQPDATERRQLLDFFNSAFVLRDHADADITLSNFALRSAHRPDLLQKWGPLVKAVALYNDHLVLPQRSEGLNPQEVILAFHLVRAFEDYIPEHLSTGFEFFIRSLPQALAWLQGIVGRFNEVKPQAFLMAVLEGLEDGSLRPPPELSLHKDLLIAELQRVRDMAGLLQILVDRGHNALKAGSFDVVQFEPSVVGGTQKSGVTLVVFVSPESEQIPDGSEVLRFVRQNADSLLDGVALFMVVTTEGEDRTRWQVKLRSVDPRFSLDSILAKVREFGGGGRAGAGRLYGSSGKETDLPGLFGDLNVIAQMTAKNCAFLLSP